MTWTIKEIAYILLTALGGNFLLNLLTLNSRRKKAAAEAEKKKLDNAEQIVEMIKDVSEEKSKFDSEKITQLLREMSELNKLTVSLKNEVHKLTKAVNEAKKCKGADNCPALKKLEEH